LQPNSAFLQTQLKIPAIQAIRAVELPALQLYHLSNGVPVYLLEGGDQDLVRLDATFPAGRTYETKKLAAVSCMHNLKEGSAKYDGEDISRKLDNLGASLAFPFSFDHVNACVMGLSRYLSEIAPIFADLVIRPTFPEEEFGLFRKRILQKLAIETAQNDIQAYRVFTELLYGKDHPYGYNSSEQLYNALTTQDLATHHQLCFGHNNLTLFLSGKPPKNWQKILDDVFGTWQHAANPIESASTSQNFAPQKVLFEHEHAQTSIRLGRKMFSAKDPDYAVMVLLNAILGGYHGSRLMKKIREELGLTYGIYSTLESFTYGGYLNISVETEKPNADRVLSEIELQLEHLQSELIAEEELLMVRNYLGGFLLSLIDGPFPTIEIMRNAFIENGDPYRLTKLYQDIMRIDSEQLRIAAKTYLSYESLTQVVVH